MDRFHGQRHCCAAVGLRGLAALLAALSLATACNATYQPRPSKLLKWTLIDGSPAVVRLGRAYPVNGFGQGLIEAVADNPRALEHAEAHREGTTWGLITALGGAAVMFGSPVLLLADSDNPGQEPSAGSVSLAIGGAVTGIVLYGLGLGMVASAQPRMYDAVNVYNDDLEVLLPPLAAPVPLPAAAAATPTDAGQP